MASRALPCRCREWFTLAALRQHQGLRRGKHGHADLIAVMAGDQRALDSELRCVAIAGVTLRAARLHLQLAGRLAYRLELQRHARQLQADAAGVLQLPAVAGDGRQGRICDA